MPSRVLPDVVHAADPPAQHESRQIRHAKEREAKRISDSIDEQLKREQLEAKKRRVVRLLLLGQSESGKSTTLRQFQLKYTPQAFKAECASWRTVIQLNIVRSIRLILETLTHEMDHQSEEIDSEIDPLEFTTEHFRLRHSLTEPLLQIEQILKDKIRSPSSLDDSTIGASSSTNANTGSYVGRLSLELTVRPDWRHTFSRFRSDSVQRPRTAPGDPSVENRDQSSEVLNALREEMITLWEDRVVTDMLRRKKVRLEEMPGFFLNDLERIATRNYVPTPDDVLRARLKTVGVSEYRFGMESAAGREEGSEWRIVDVGGSRSQRQTWVPFMDIVNAIIFLCPISAFDQVLAEDRSVNRLEDSAALWKQVCSNKLLSKIDLILFLNKMDILDAKLQAGVRLAKYVKNFGDRSNDVETVAKYLRSKFHAIQKEYSPTQRRFYCFCTSVTDTTATSGILASVRDIIVREYLKQSRLL